MIATEKILDDKDKKILMLIAHGNPYKEIAGKVQLSVDGIKKRVRAMKTHFKTNSTPALIAHITRTYTKV